MPETANNPDSLFDPEPDHDLDVGTIAIDTSANVPDDTVVVTLPTDTQADEIVVNALGWSVADLGENADCDEDDTLVRGISKPELDRHVGDRTVSDLGREELLAMRDDPSFPAERWFPISRLEVADVDA